MTDILKFMENLIDDMNDLSWTIEKIVQGEKVVEDDEI